MTRRIAFKRSSFVGDNQSPDISSLVNDLTGMQSAVTQYAPQLASQWGWLARQGQLIVSGQGASITADQWVSQYRAFFSALQDAEGGQNALIAKNFNNAVAQGGVTGVEGSLLQAGNDVTSGVGNFLSSLAGYVPWIVGAIVLAIALPPLIEAFEE